MKVVAPWSDQQVEALNTWQTNQMTHPFTCPRDGSNLVAIQEGWVCMATGCTYKQDWAHDFMMLPVPMSWKGAFRQSESNGNSEKVNS